MPVFAQEIGAPGQQVELADLLLQRGVVRIDVIERFQQLADFRLERGRFPDLEEIRGQHDGKREREDGRHGGDIAVQFLVHTRQGLGVAAGAFAFSRFWGQ